ncbi:MAG: hypothetical protein H8E14_06190 [Candidatus Marinimicrobia bacterium]|nr:hypothetical protein [Candidatus Neomarinimicrobiota bacterium]
MEEFAISKQFRGYTIHYVDQDGNGYLSRFNQVFQVNNEGHLKLLVTLPYTKSIYRFIKNNLVERLTRTNISHILPLNDESLLVFFDHKIYKLDPTGALSEYYIKTCRRPVNIYYNNITERILWGDYLASYNNVINIYESRDLGKSWDILYTFPRGTIRHIHNIVYDKYSQHFWVLTGDSDEESGIWKTKDFKDFKPFLVGSQSYRSMSIIPTADGLLIPTDTEYNENYIQFYSYKSSRLKRIQKLDGSAFFAQRINDNYFISTVCEPSKTNKIKYTDLWISKDINNWNRILHLKGDIFAGRVFRYPSIKLPYYSDNYFKDFIYLSARSVKGGTYTIKINI